MKIINQGYIFRQSHARLTAPVVDRKNAGDVRVIHSLLQTRTLNQLAFKYMFPKLLFQLTSPWVKCLKGATHLEFESNQTDHIIITNKFQDYHFVFWHQYWLSYFRHLHTFNVSCGCVGMRFVVFCLMFDVGFRVRKFTFRFFYKFVRSVVFAMFTCSYHLWFLVCYDPPMLSQNRIN